MNPCFDYSRFFYNLKFSTKKFFRIFLIGVTSSDPIQMDSTAKYGWWLKPCTSWYGKYPIIYKVWHIPGG